RLTRAGRGDQQEVASRQPEVLVVGILLPAAKARKEIIPNGLGLRSVRSRGGHEAEMLPARTVIRRQRHAGVTRRRRRPGGAPRRSPCRWGTPGSASGRG